LDLVGRKFVSAFCVWGSAGFLLFFVKRQDPYFDSIPKGQMKFEQTPDIPAIAGDGLAYGVPCLQFSDSSLEL
jgi:hypothetical protein